MMDWPLISIITPTWQRHDLLIETIAEVEVQTYPNLEHIIVCEGVDYLLREKVQEVDTKIPTFYYECGKNWSSILPDSYCAIPVMLGQFLSRGSFQTFWADDERMDPDHIEILYRALVDNPEAGFSYSKFILWDKGNPNRRWEMGADPPEHGYITNCLYRTELLNIAHYRPYVTRAGDWDLIRRWMEAGVKWAYVDEATFVHRNDNV